MNMTKDQIEARIKEKEEAITNLEGAHQKFVEQFNRQIALNRDEYNKLQGSIAELKTFLDDPPDA